MGLTKDQLTNALGISKDYYNDELSESERRMSALIQALYEVITNQRDDALHVLDENIGIEDNPVGHILSYMGKKAPKHYLICDGKEYKISDYPILSKHIADEFGAANYFGGDGTTTFAVPDLRGEFLRGSGKASRNTGSGGEVGTHQDGTIFPIMFGDKGTGVFNFSLETPNTMTNRDATIGEGKTNYFSSTTRNGNWTTTATTAATSRPTNTAVLYCIKFEPTFYIRAGYDQNYLTTEETCIGLWKDGRSLYRKMIDIPSMSLSSSNTMWVYPTSNISSNIDTIVNISGYFKTNVGSGKTIQTIIVPSAVNGFEVVAFFDSSISSIYLAFGTNYANRKDYIYGGELIIDYIKSI